MHNPTDGSAPIALYVHIPFCETKCPYCDFNTYAGIEPLMPDYVAALRAEIGLWGRLLGNPRVRSVFFGGGTPSYLPTVDIGSLMDSITDAFDVSADSENTLEANPGDLSAAGLDAYLGSGVNRLSIGVQSLDDELLRGLGRRHSASEAVQSFRAALDAGFDNVSIDLMYGLPDQTIAQWERTLAQALALGPQHLSMYCLTLEEGTPLATWVASGRVPEPDPDLAADMYEAAEGALDRLGYRHYEISNWARPGRESRHNLTYWLNEPYLGVGPGAHSYLSGRRFHNLKSPRDYVARMLYGSAPRGDGGAGPSTIDSIDPAAVPVVESVEDIGRRLEMAETMMMGLRLDAGVTVTAFERRFGESPAGVYGGTIGDLQAAGLLDTAGGAVRLTARGRLLGNEVFSRFLDSSFAV